MFSKVSMKIKIDVSKSSDRIEIRYKKVHIKHNRHFSKKNFVVAYVITLCP